MSGNKDKQDQVQIKGLKEFQTQSDSIQAILTDAVSDALLRTSEETIGMTVGPTVEKLVDNKRQR